VYGALLVVPLKVGKIELCNTGYVILECQYVGSVYTNLQWGESYTASIRLGKLTQDPQISAKEVVDNYNRIYDDHKGPPLMGRHPWAEHLDSIRLARRKASDRMAENQSTLSPDKW